MSFEFLECGQMELNGQMQQSSTVTTITTATATLTAAQVVNGIISDTYAGTSTLTLPLGSAISAIFSNVFVGLSFTTKLIVNSATTMAFTTNTGLTIVSGSTKTQSLVFVNTGVSTWNVYVS